MRFKQIIETPQPNVWLAVTEDGDLAEVNYRPGTDLQAECAVIDVEVIEDEPESRSERE